MFDHDRYFYFFQLNPTSGEWSFTSYADREGNTYRAIQSIDPKGNKRPFEVKFSKRERIYRGSKTHKIWVEKNGGEPKQFSLYDYIKGYPDCEGSPNYRGVSIFKELDEVKDAKVAVDRIKLRVDAANAVLNLTPEERSDFAPLIAVFNDNPDVQQRRLLEYADNDPEGFFDLFNDPARELRSLIKRGVRADVIKPQGRSLVWEKEVWADEDDMVSSLLKDNVKLKALKNAVKKLK